MGIGVYQEASWDKQHMCDTCLSVGYSEWDWQGHIGLGYYHACERPCVAHC